MTHRPPAPALAIYAAALAVFAWALITYSASLSDRCVASSPCRAQLQPAWLLLSGRLIDLADHQWRVFRNQLLLLLVVSVTHAAGGAVVRRIPMSRRRDACVGYDALTGVLLVGFIHRAQ